MGVLNVTPDSFSDGGRFLDPGRAIAHLIGMAEAGADIIDIGAESTRPGSDPVPAEEQWRRIGPIIKEISRESLPCRLSVDTSEPLVAGRALEAGVDIINDISSLRSHPELGRMVAEAGAGLVLMHMRGTPKTMQQEPKYDDLFGEVRYFLNEAIRRAMDAGVDRERIVCDPGIGFGKRVEDNLDLISNIEELDSLERPILIGASRKSFIGKILDLPSDERLEGSLAAHVTAVLSGAHIIRAHDAIATIRAARLADAVLERIRER